MGNAASHSLPQNEIENIVENTNFNSKQVARLYERFQRLDKKENGWLTKDDFLAIPELAINPLADRIIDMFLNQKNENANKNNQNEDSHATSEDRVNFFDFCTMLSNFKTSFNRDKTDQADSQRAKLKFLFKMYDHDGDGFIKTEELLRLLRLMVGHNISHQQLQLIAERTIAETDKDNDGGLDFNEFCEGLKSVDIDGKMTVRFAE